MRAVVFGVLLGCCALAGALDAEPSENVEVSEVSDPKPALRKKPFGRGRQNRGPPFLQGLSEDSRAEFRQLFKDQSLSRKQFREKVHQWAATQSVEVQDKIAKFEAEHDKQAADSKTALADTLQKLPEVVARLNKVRDDETIGRKQRRGQTREILAEYDALTAATARFLITHQQRQQRRQLGGRRRRRNFWRRNGRRQFRKARRFVKASHAVEAEDDYKNLA